MGPVNTSALSHGIARDARATVSFGSLNGALIGIFVGAFTTRCGGCPAPGCPELAVAFWEQGVQLNVPTNWTSAVETPTGAPDPEGAPVGYPA